MTKLFPSLLAADFLYLDKELNALEEAGVDGLHFDVMDGQFVPNISVGLPVLNAVRRGTNLPIDVHLMIEEPEHYVEHFANYGANMISVHVEATSHIHSVIQKIKDKDVKAGVAINPGTPVSLIEPLLSIIDYVLVMTVNPGFGGQVFIDSCLEKVKYLATLRNELNLNYEIEVDGGINENTANKVIEYGATMLVAGSYFFQQADYSTAAKQLKG
ncbi:ribulose-phosphate 3-epimerase [Staphylococcus sp. SQ8-PEA]|uniref:Ribulose-phosphate 3-epimerase n=1 Tax=Staphylococcus marylandisciuri TaxID=2981529 RepID=A0ABT2QP49_9STAP|nr:ribulose-phosphate 3-epimerase [Staphylococcus marylandisciuri]MCU5745753.1 ribulose-phosphate 3-epimerase [Staphylococcus marylandisciuri]